MYNKSSKRKRESNDYQQNQTEVSIFWGCNLIMTWHLYPLKHLTGQQCFSEKEEQVKSIAMGNLTIIEIKEMIANFQNCDTQRIVCTKGVHQHLDWHYQRLDKHSIISRLMAYQLTLSCGSDALQLIHDIASLMITKWNNIVSAITCVICIFSPFT